MFADVGVIVGVTVLLGVIVGVFVFVGVSVGVMVFVGIAYRDWETIQDTTQSNTSTN